MNKTINFSSDEVKAADKAVDEFFDKARGKIKSREMLENVEPEALRLSFLIAFRVRRRIR